MSLKTVAKRALSLSLGFLPKNFSRALVAKKNFGSLSRSHGSLTSCGRAQATIKSNECNKAQIMNSSPNPIQNNMSKQEPMTEKHLID